MKYSELKKILKKDGWYIIRHGSRHDIYSHPSKEMQIPIGRHDKEDVPKGTLNSILKQAGLK